MIGSNDKDPIKNEKIELKTFKLDKVESARFQKFTKNHIKCQLDENNYNKFGAIGGGFSITFSLSDKGNIIVCKCAGCNESANITNVDNLK